MEQIPSPQPHRRARPMTDSDYHEEDDDNSIAKRLRNIEMRTEDLELDFKIRVGDLEQDVDYRIDDLKHKFNSLQTKLPIQAKQSVATSIPKDTAGLDSNIDQKLASKALLNPHVSIQVCDTESAFFHRKGSVHCIEILQQSSDSRNSRRSVSRHVGGPSNSTNDIVPVEMPSRIRIRSPLIIELLELVSKTDLRSKARPTSTDSDAVSIVFLYPFKLFVRHENSILEYIERILDGAAGASKDDQHRDFVQYETYFVEYIERLLDTAADASKDGQHSDSQILPIPAHFQGDEARKHFVILKTLFKEHLDSLFQIRREFRNQTRTTITFEHLWLLFDSGDIVYEREPSHGPLNIPRLWRITQYGCGREILNDNALEMTDLLLRDSLPGKGSKKKENYFWVRGYSLRSTGKNIVVEESSYVIPPWDPTIKRQVHELKFFPYQFCQPDRDFAGEDRDAWFNRLITEGEKYSKLTPGKAVHLNGIGVGEDSKVAEYHSQVIIDFEQAQKEAPLLSQTAAEIASLLFGRSSRMRSPPQWFFVHLSDSREVEEIPPRVSAESQTNKILDSIHNDNMFDHEYFLGQIKNITPTLAAFNTSEAFKIKRENYVLFPRTLYGFVLSAREWVEFEIRDMKKARFNKALWKELKLPNRHKRALLATIRTHVRVKDLQPEHDSVPGKGAGAIILLQGSSGVGKTFTAEALAAHTNRPLYCITSGDLGDSVSTVEKQLVKILHRGSRWGCVILLDEADVYLTKRGQSTFGQNAIVSTFLRQLEWYPGIMILTTNRSTDIDDAVIQRFQLRLFYPPLNKEAVSKIWALYCTKEKCQQLIADRASKKPTVKIDEKVLTWWEKPYEQSTLSTQTSIGESVSPISAIQDNGQPWWSGRNIQFAFREAIALAVHDKVSEKRAHAKIKRANAAAERAKMVKKGKTVSENKRSQVEDLLDQADEEFRNSKAITEEDEIIINTAHFDEVLERLKFFDDGIRSMHDLDSSGISTEAPDENLHYTDDEVDKISIADSDTLSDDTDGSENDGLN